jgi:hypothetical protein
MKNAKQLLLLAAWLFSTGTHAQADKEVAAVKAVIERETTSFFNVNRKDWEDSWLHVPYVYWSYSDSTGTSFIEGWEALNKSFDEYFRTQVASRNIDVAHQSAAMKIEREWKDIRVYGNGAYAHYIQRVKDDRIERDETSQIRVLEKKDGKWKIICVGAIAKYPND